VSIKTFLPQIIIFLSSFRSFQKKFPLFPFSIFPSLWRHLTSFRWASLIIYRQTEVNPRYLLYLFSSLFLVWIWAGVNFTNMFTHCFYTHRSQKCKKTVKYSVPFWAFRIFTRKSCLMLVKLTPARFIHKKYVESIIKRNQQLKLGM